MHDLTLNNILQLTYNGIVNGAEYALLGVGFGLILGVSGRFHIAFIGTYTAAAFAAALITTEYHVPWWAAIVVGGIVSAILGVLMERFIYRRLAVSSVRAGANPLLMIFVASLGLSTIVINLISLAAAGFPSPIVGGFDDAGYNVGPVTMTKLSLIIIGVSILLTVLTNFLLTATTLGRTVRAVRANPEMALCVGINPGFVYLTVFGIGGFLGGVAAVLHATQTSASIDIGLYPFFYALVVAFVAGLTSSPLRVALTGLVLGLIENLSALFLPTQLTTLVVFVILFGYVALRPVNFKTIGRRRSVPRPATPAAPAAGG